MRCTRCGAELVVGTSVCPSCGQSVSTVTTADDTLFFDASVFRSRGAAQDEEPAPASAAAPAVAPAPTAMPELFSEQDELTVPTYDDIRRRTMAPEPEPEPDVAPAREPESDSQEPQPESQAATSEPEPEPEQKAALAPQSNLRPIPPAMDNSELPVPFEVDPFIGDGSAGGNSVDVAVWRLHTLNADHMHSVSEPVGQDRKSRRARRARAASRKARDKERRDNRSRTRATIGCVLAGVLILGLLVGGTYVLEVWGGKTIPNVAGLSQSKAQEQLGDRGFSVKITTEPSDTVEGHVVGVQPEPGTRVAPGSEITIVVGESRHIPEVVGMQREQARATLKEAGAENIRFETRANLSAEDVVLEVNPPAGSVFMSSEEVLVVVSQLPAVPDVVGMTTQEAITSLTHEGLPYIVRYERSDVSNRLKVLRTDPAAGSPAAENGVTLIAGDPLVNYARVSDYFDATAANIRTFVESEGFSPQVGYITNDGWLVARFAEPGGTVLAFDKNPWLHEVMNDQNPFTEVMGESMSIDGVRLVIPIAKTGEGTPEPKAKISSTNVSEATAKEVMALCGLDNILGSCTQHNIKLPDGTPNDGHNFYCCYGESGRNVWTVLVRSERYGDAAVAKEAVVTCAPKDVYRSANLASFGNQPCDFVAYHDDYQE